MNTANTAAVASTQYLPQKLLYLTNNATEPYTSYSNAIGNNTYIDTFHVYVGYCKNWGRSSSGCNIYICEIIVMCLAGSKHTNVPSGVFRILS